MERDSEEAISVSRLIELRQDRNMTQREFAELIGTSKSTVNYWEKGKLKGMNSVKIKNIAKKCGVSPMWLFGLDVPKYGNDMEHEKKIDRICEKLHKMDDKQLSKVEAMIDLFILDDKKDGSRND